MTTTTTTRSAGTENATIAVDAAEIDPVTTARDIVALAVEADVTVATLPTRASRRELAAENLWILRSLLAGQWTAAHTARNSIEPIRLSPPAHPVRIV